MSSSSEEDEEFDFKKFKPNEPRQVEVQFPAPPESPDEEVPPRVEDELPPSVEEEERVVPVEPSTNFEQPVVSQDLFSEPSYVSEETDTDSTGIFIT